jgi:two-component system sensor histidine kinase CpxA
VAHAGRCGPGIPEAELKDIFRPFYRIDRARSTETGGFGVGLAIAERTVKLHGGELGASNRQVGGLTVRPKFPRSHVLVDSSYA